MVSQQLIVFLDLDPNRFKSKRGSANMAYTRLGVTWQWSRCDMWHGWYHE